MRPRAIAVEPANDYNLLVTFSNNEKKIFDVKPYFEYPIFDSLRKNGLFNTVKIGGLSVEWANGADICPDELYYDSVKFNTISEGNYSTEINLANVAEPEAKYGSANDK